MIPQRKLRAAWEWMTYNRGPLAYLSVGVKFIRSCALLPLLVYLMPPTQPVASVWAWIAFWVYAACQVIAWFIDSVLDADGSGS